MSNVRYEEIAIAEDFDTIRDRTAEAQAVWCRRAAAYLPDAPPPSIVDIGAGTGIWSLAFAEALGVRVHAVEPSRGMRARAMAARPHPLVTYTEGSVERLPLDDDAVGCRLALDRRPPVRRPRGGGARRSVAWSSPVGRY